MTVYSVLWLAWIAMFAGVEGTAIIHKDDKPGKAATLTANVRWVISGNGVGHQFARAALILLLIWLPNHFGLPLSCT